MSAGLGGGSQQSWATLRWVSVGVLSVVIAAYLVAVPAGLIPKADRLSPQEIALGAVLLLGVTFLAQSQYSLTDLSLGASGVTAKFERLEGRQDALESEVRALSVAVGGLVTKYEFVHLEKLTKEGPAVVRYGDIMLAELTHLDAMTFLRPRDVRGLNALREDHGSGLDEFDLKSYIEVTQEGREYLALRARLAARLAQDELERPR